MIFQNSYLEGDNEPICQHNSFGFLLLSSIFQNVYSEGDNESLRVAWLF